MGERRIVAVPSMTWDQEVPRTGDTWRATAGNRTGRQYRVKHVSPHNVMLQGLDGHSRGKTFGLNRVVFERDFGLVKRNPFTAAAPAPAVPPFETVPAPETPAPAPAGRGGRNGRDGWLTDAEIRAICELVLGGIDAADIAKEYRISTSYVRKIARGTTKPDLTADLRQRAAQPKEEQPVFATPSAPPPGTAAPTAHERELAGALATLADTAEALLDLAGKPLSPILLLDVESVRRQLAEARQIAKYPPA